MALSFVQLSRSVCPYRKPPTWIQAEILSDNEYSQSTTHQLYFQALEDQYRDGGIAVLCKTLMP